jgi:hypothetical protein
VTAKSPTSRALGLEQAKKAFRALSEGKSAEEAAQLSGLSIDEISVFLT